ncbi:hypothetical protein BT96DRAFT_935818 [Gymnopus androsaceus JB14]|uniref:Uncharacterized protein n=1 Tax=Gymnopus androsaceus JB14 TaxID=1447944 RepID=A0A6A4I1L3_9AGAR|nr:hypothetical protein BT96DRAFT_935818 [Gymnopus androsaceus JB14]
MQFNAKALFGDQSKVSKFAWVRKVQWTHTFSLSILHWSADLTFDLWREYGQVKAAGLAWTMHMCGPGVLSFYCNGNSRIEPIGVFRGGKNAQWRDRWLERAKHLLCTSAKVPYCLGVSKLASGTLRKTGTPREPRLRRLTENPKGHPPIPRDISGCPWMSLDVPGGALGSPEVSLGIPEVSLNIPGNLLK